MKANDLEARLGRVLERFDDDRDRIVEGLHGATGNYGGMHEHFNPLLEVLADTLYASREALKKSSRGEELTRPERAASKRAEPLTTACEALVVLAGIKD